ncbi:cysteine proteinase [Annulohypoxylon maeteangense]|uniref:cysteine proteinase n=1 Tax=Annulohypoxylon maeteangense TaxID=1927788 RepID=UPI0020079941|nr:cysteine proteinase [Annulohypoxylon maeteangense]KAI0884484.1 cysteine proteinase [Annulohypoxylon maeteangense]
MSSHFKGRMNGLGAVVPTNNLNGRNQPSSRLVRSSPPHPSSPPPPAKRPKIEDSFAHTQSHFAIVLDRDATPDKHAPRKRSLDNTSDSQQTFRSQPSNSKGIHLTQPHISEYRSVENFIKAPSRKRVRRDRSESADRIFIEDHEERDMDSDGDVECIEAPEQAKNAHTRTQGPTREEDSQPITAFASRFGDRGKGAARVNQSTTAATRLGKIIENTERKIPEWRNGKLKSMDSSPDELAPEAQDMRGKVLTKRPVTPSPSLSKRGDIAPTKFSSLSNARPNITKGTANKLTLENAKEIIGSRLLIVRAVSGRYKYEVHKTSSVDECFLKLRDMSHILHPTNLDGDILKQYSYLTINMKKILSVHIPSNPDYHVVSISRSLDAATSASPKLMIEFKTSEDIQHFKEWMEMGSEDGLQLKLSIFGDREKVDKEFLNLMSKAERSTVITDQEPVGDDIKLIQHNTQDRARQAKFASRPHISNNQPVKTKDLMRPYGTTAPSNVEVTIIPHSSVASPAQRPVRTTRSTFALKSPSSASEPPEPEGWTVLNEGWEKNWRNSLVFPTHGKNRATVDKEDIPRLDEGQFLNDNVLAFYLRYLQHSLEAERPDLAQRIYFQNTFFYSKLKSSRTSQGINYDSVKAWTSKVDLFTKDYIIVPINEYTHWYVAIIYNAPKLLPSADKEVSDAQSTDTITIEEDSHNSGDVSTALPEDGNLIEPTNIEAVISAAQNDITNHLSLIEPEEQKEEAQSSGNEQDVELVKGKNSPKADADQDSLPNDSLRQKKPNKRQSIGPRNARKYDPTQPRIITLDSLGITHSPACGCLKQYLIAELKDKKGIEISTPGALGMTAKNVPQQTNHCDCGPFLLGYIQQFLKDPDTFVHSLLQHENDIPWDLNPSQIRNEIRDLIFKLQKEQQDREDAHREEKRNKNGPKKKSPAIDQQSAPPGKKPIVDQSLSEHLEDHAIPKDNEAIAKPKPRSPTPNTSDFKSKSVSEVNEDLHMPGSFPQSPAVSRSNTRGSSTVAESETPKQTKLPKFVSPLPGSSGDSSPTRPIFVVDSTASPEQRQDLTRGPTNHKAPYSTVEILDDLVKERQRPASKGRDQEETPTTSPYFAGRRPADRMASAKLHQEPDQSRIVVDLSD